MAGGNLTGSPCAHLSIPNITHRIQWLCAWSWHNSILHFREITADSHRDYYRLNRPQLQRHEFVAPSPTQSMGEVASTKENILYHPHLSRSEHLQSFLLPVNVCITDVVSKREKPMFISPDGEVVHWQAIPVSNHMACVWDGGIILIPPESCQISGITRLGSFFTKTRVLEGWKAIFMNDDGVLVIYVGISRQPYDVEAFLKRGCMCW